jgi:hypothetical protein
MRSFDWHRVGLKLVVIGFALASGIPRVIAQGPADRTLDAKLQATESFELRAMNAGDRDIARSAARSALKWATEQTGLALHSLPVIEVYATAEMFRRATGEPEWVAASTVVQHVRIEPPGALQEKFESVLRHEFLHMLVEDNAAADTPLWFREGLVVYLGGDPPSARSLDMSVQQVEQGIRSRQSAAEMRHAYGEAAEMVSDLEKQYGRNRLIEWLKSGIPRNVRSGFAAIVK